MPSRANCSPWPSRAATRPTSACCSGRTKRDPACRSAGAAGAADAVDVALVVLGRVEVDHVGDVGEVEAAGGDVGRDERLHRARAEPAERALALALRHVAVQRRSAGTSRAWSLRASRSAPRFVRTKTSARPRSASSSSISGRACRRRSPRRRCARPRPVLVRRAAAPRRATGCRVGAGQLADLAVERRREEHRLAVAGSRRTIRSTCGLKPMSSIRSASSRTSVRTRSSETSRRSIRSCRRPGVATRMCAPRARFAWREIGAPP